MNDIDWRASREYRVWRAGVIRRDTRCMVCDSLQDRHAHHLNSASYFPDERFNVSNGVCLCQGCHTQYHTNFNKSYRVKTTEDNFKNFLSFVGYLKSIIK